MPCGTTHAMECVVSGSETCCPKASLLYFREALAAVRVTTRVSATRAFDGTTQDTNEGAGGEPTNYQFTAA